MRRRQERDWPTLPIPFFAFRELYEEFARPEWQGLPPFELVDQALVLSALAHPYASAGGKPAYPSVPAKGAALFRGLVKNHGLRDGNKRLAVTVMSAFLLSNGWLPKYTNLQLYRYALRVARQKGSYPVPTIERWIRRNAELALDKDLDFLREQNRTIYAQGDVFGIAFRPVPLPLVPAAPDAPARAEGEGPPPK
jgi:prophage maintenance system killer protein